MHIKSTYMSSLRYFQFNIHWCFIIQHKKDTKWIVVQHLKLNTRCNPVLVKINSRQNVRFQKLSIFFYPCQYLPKFPHTKNKINYNQHRIYVVILLSKPFPCFKQFIYIQIQLNIIVRHAIASTIIDHCASNASKQIFTVVIDTTVTCIANITTPWSIIHFFCTISIVASLKH